MRYFSTIAVIATAFILAYAGANDAPAGHDEPFGAHRKSEPMEEVQGAPSPEDFVNKYLLKFKPVLMRGAHKSAAVNSWEPAQLKSKYGSLQVSTEKLNHTWSLEDNTTSLEPVDISIADWLDLPKKDTFVLSQIPEPMLKDLELPAFAFCPPVSDALLESHMQMTVSEYHTLLQKDASNTLVCQVRGQKHWQLVEHEHVTKIPMSQDFPESDPHNEPGGYSLLDVKKVDLKKHPELAEVPYFDFTTKPGDCLYLPGSMIYHAHTHEGDLNIDVNYIISGPTVTQKEKYPFTPFDAAKCAGKTASTVDKAEVAWTYDGSGRNAMTMGYEDPNQFKDSLLKEIKTHDGKLDVDQFKEVMLKMLMAIGSKSTEELTRSIVDKAVEVVFNTGAAGKDHITEADVRGLNRKSLVTGLRDYFVLDFKFTMDSVNMLANFDSDMFLEEHFGKGGMDGLEGLDIGGEGLGADLNFDDDAFMKGGEGDEQWPEDMGDLEEKLAGHAEL